MTAKIIHARFGVERYLDDRLEEALDIRERVDRIIEDLQAEGSPAERLLRLLEHDSLS